MYPYRHLPFDPEVTVNTGLFGDTIFIMKLGLLIHLFYKLLQTANTFSQYSRVKKLARTTRCVLIPTPVSWPAIFQ